MRRISQTAENKKRAVADPPSLSIALIPTSVRQVAFQWRRIGPDLINPLIATTPEPVEIILATIILVVILVIVFSGPERVLLDNLGHDRARESATFVQRRFEASAVSRS